MQTVAALGTMGLIAGAAVLIFRWWVKRQEEEDGKGADVWKNVPAAKTLSQVRVSACMLSVHACWCWLDPHHASANAQASWHADT